MVYIIIEQRRFYNKDRSYDANRGNYRNQRLNRMKRDERDWNHNAFDAVYNSEKELKREEYRNMLREEVNRRLKDMQSSS